MLSTRTIFVTAALLASAFLAGFAKPELKVGKDVHLLSEGVPKTIGHWRWVPSNRIQVELSPIAENAERSAAGTYDETVMRTYADNDGHHIMLALAYGRNQRQEQKIHRPELCYVAQGFELKSVKSSSIDLSNEGFKKITSKRMMVSAANQKEAVSYWIRTGSLYSDNAFESRMQIFKDGLKGEVPDGILVRVSQILPNNASAADFESAYTRQEDFLKQLVAATPAEYRNKIVR